MHAFPGGTINRKEVGTGEGVGTEKVLECSHWSVYVYIYIYMDGDMIYGVNCTTVHSAQHYKTCNKCTLRASWSIQWVL